jgi:hypothetical protein
MATSLAPVLRQRYGNANFAPLAGGKLYTYQSGTTTPQVTYTNAGGLTANTNPVILDANGEASIWLDVALSYKFVLKDSNDVEQWTTDGVIGLSTNDSVSTASIQNLAVTTGKLADDSVTAAKLADDASIDANRAVTTNHIRDSAITTAKINALAVTPAKMAAGNSGKWNVTAKTTTYTAVIGDLVKCTSGTFTTTLQTAVGVDGQEICVKNAGTGIITVATTSAQTIDGSSTDTVYSLDAKTYVSDGSNWVIV